MAKDLQLVTAFRGFEDREEVLSVEDKRKGVLVGDRTNDNDDANDSDGSKNVVVHETGVVQTRWGHTEHPTISFDDTSGSDVAGTYTWNNSRGREINVVAMRNGHVYFRDRVVSNKYFEIDDIGSMDADELDFTTWYNEDLKLDRLLICNGTGESIFYWLGGTARITAVSGNTIDVDLEGNSTVYDLGFDASGIRNNVIINGDQYEIDSISGNTITLDSTPTGVGVNDVLHHQMGELDSFDFDYSTGGTKVRVTNTNFYDQFGAKITTMTTLNNQVYYGSKDNPRLFIASDRFFSKITYGIDANDLTPIRGDGFTAVLDDGIEALTLNDEQSGVIAFCGDSKVFLIKEFALATNTVATSFSIEQLRAENGSGVLNKNCIANTPKGLVYVNKRKELDYVYRIERRETPSSKAISYPISRTMEYKLEDTAAIIYFDNKVRIWTQTDDDSKCAVLTYEFERDIWQPPASCAFQGGFPFVEEETLWWHGTDSYDYRVFRFEEEGAINDNIDGTGDIAIEQRAIFALDDFNVRENKKQVTQMYVEGYLHRTTYAEDEAVDVTTVFDFGNSVLRDGVEINPGHYVEKQIVSNDAETVFFETDKNSNMNAYFPGDSLGARNEYEYAFRSHFNMHPHDFYHLQTIFSSNTIDTHFKLTAYGYGPVLSKSNSHRVIA